MLNPDSGQPATQPSHMPVSAGAGDTGGTHECFTVLIDEGEMLIQPPNTLLVLVKGERRREESTRC